MKTFAKPILTTVNRKVPYQKYLDPIFYSKSYELAKVPNKPKADRKGSSLQNLDPGSNAVQIGQN